MSLKSIFLFVALYSVVLSCYFLVEGILFCSLISRKHDKAECEIQNIRFCLEWSTEERDVDSIRRNCRLDPWGHEYQWVEHRDDEVFESEILRWHVYSFGEDGVSQSSGNDKDDINSWNYSAATHYLPSINRQQIAEDAKIAILLAVPLFVGWTAIAIWKRFVQRQQTPTS